MRKPLFLLVVWFFPFILQSNEISWPYLKASDYYRGTAGERLFFLNHAEPDVHFYFFNDSRNYQFDDYFDPLGEKQSNYYSYTRWINIFSLNLRIKKLILSCRVPYVRASNQWNFQYIYKNAGISDVFLGAAFRIFAVKRGGIFVATGLKFPTSANFQDWRKIPIGTGSYDVPVMINSDFSFRNTHHFLDAGFIFTGTSKPSQYYNSEREENGDEIFVDYRLTKRISRFSLLAEVNYFYIFKTFSYYLLVPLPEPMVDNSTYKLSLVPGVALHIARKLVVEAGYSVDLNGQNVYAGNAWVLRVFGGF